MQYLDNLILENVLIQVLCLKSFYYSSYFFKIVYDEIKTTTTSTKQKLSLVDQGHYTYFYSNYRVENTVAMLKFVFDIPS